MIYFKEYLENTVWCTLKPSPLEGIGVFAIRDIPKGTRITDHTIHNINDTPLFTMELEEFNKIIPEIKQLILDRNIFTKEKPLTFYSPNSEYCLTSFLNHSDTPNSHLEVTLRDIKAGEEITIGYPYEFKDVHEISIKHMNGLL